jgi:hypothetical protein
MPHRVRLRDSSIPETARLIRDQQSLRWGLALRTRHSRHYREAIYALAHRVESLRCEGSDAIGAKRILISRVGQPPGGHGEARRFPPP